MRAFHEEFECRGGRLSIRAVKTTSRRLLTLTTWLATSVTLAGRWWFIPLGRCVRVAVSRVVEFDGRVTALDQFASHPGLSEQDQYKHD